ncbi:MAG: redoxin domain-containing protein [Lysobacter sp.]|nr:redoxin domain-containing protein [Lysobacter sp.]
MDDALIQMLLFFLLAAVTVNLVLTLRLAAIVREAPEPASPTSTLELDVVIPDFRGTMLADRRTLSAEALAGRATVLVFVSSRCGDCRRKVPEIERLLPAMGKAGIVLLVVAMDSEARMRKFLGDTPLLEHVLVLGKEQRRRLNPLSATPFYVFVDDQRIARASDYIGDENWESFVGQMQELAIEEEPAHG